MRLSEVVRERLAASELAEGPRSLIGAALSNVDSPIVTGAPMLSEVFLTSLSVEGFRGIGKKVTVPFRPGAGLTVITGRNGSGKSSLAESIELLLTGDNARWSDKKNSDLRKGWKNLHHPGDTQIDLEFSARGVPMTGLSRRWSGADAKDLDVGTSMVKRPGKEPVPMQTLGWSQALKTYRPFLSYGELGGLIEDGPSRLHDAIANILGLEEFTAIKDTLSATKSALKAQLKASKDAWTALAGELAASADGRAAAIAAATAKKGWTPDQVEALLTDGDSGDETIGGWCRAVASIASPPVATVARCVEALVDSVAAVDALHGSDAQTALATATLLEQAVALHRSVHLVDCPVCGTASVLDDAWRARAEADVDRLQAEASAASSALQELLSTERQLRQSLPTVPAVLRQLPTGLDDPVASAVTKLRSDWSAAVETFQTRPPAQLTSDAPSLVTALVEGLGTVQAGAAAVLEAADSDWTPFARKLRAWCAQAATLGSADMKVKESEAAETWVNSLSDEFRAKRLAPIRTAVESVWNDLRCDSNITLSNFELDGRGTRRRVNLELSVDDTPAPTLGVLSQGEMHALALSMFLPRAALDESPFRFLVIDDPVQAMDPSKVDGLARQLAKVAETRQVIVLTHDDRLPEAVRRLGIEARVLEVLRSPKSGVTVASRIDPTERCLKAANDVLKDTKLPADIARQVVAGQCRLALEAECIDLIRTRKLRAGAAIAAVDAVLDNAKTLNELISLLMMNDSRRLGEAELLVDQEMRGGRALLKNIQRETHGTAASTVEPKSLLDETRKLVKALRRSEER